MKSDSASNPPKPRSHEAAKSFREIHGYDTGVAPSSRALELAILFSVLLVAAGIPLFQALYEWTADGERPHFFTLFTREPSKKNLHGWDNAAKDRSLAANAIRPATLQLRYEVLRELGPKALQGREDWLFYTPDVEYLYQPGYRNARFFKNSFDTTIGGKRVNLRNPMVAILDFRDQLKARGIELVVVPVPGKPSIYPEMLAAGVDGGAVQSPTLKLLEEMRQNGLTVVDLFAPLLAAKKAEGTEKRGLYLKQDTHWTPKGAEVAAREIARVLREMPALRETVRGGPADTAAGVPAAADTAGAGAQAQAPADAAGSGRRYALKEVMVDRYGDIAEMTKLPNRKAIWGAEKVAARQVVLSREGGLYRDSDSSDVLYLGDSFSRIYQTDEPKSAGIIAHLAYELDRPVSSIVNDGGASTVVRQVLLRKGRLLENKKVVVWEFVERDIRFGAQGWKLEPLPR